VLLRCDFYGTPSVRSWFIFPFKNSKKKLLATICIRVCKIIVCFSVQVIFTDETTIELNIDRVTRVRRGPGETLLSCHTNPRAAFHTKVMFWGAVSIMGPGPLVAISGNITSAVYVDIVKTHLLPTAHAWFGDTEWLLQQDNAPPHTAKATRRAFSESGIHVLDWPPNSPDANCIENVWGLLKRMVHSHGTGSTRNDLIERVSDVWYNDNTFRDVCIRTVMSMPRRIQALCRSKGHVTKY
jgi:hypothetical protein